MTGQGGWARRELLEVLERLAAPAERQVRYLTQLGVAPSADELALELDDLVGLLPQLVEQGELTPEQAAGVEAIARKFGEMSGDASLWSVAALSDREPWEEVRRLAASSLQLMAARA